MIKIIYLVCLEKDYKFFRDYINTIKEGLGINDVIIFDVMNYNYKNDSEILYIFCHDIPNNLINKKFNKILLNTEQLTIKRFNIQTEQMLNGNIPVIDYSIENIMTLEKDSSVKINDMFHLSNNVHIEKFNTYMKKKSIVYIPYQYLESEVELLKKYYNTIPKIYDVAFCGAVSDRRNHIISELQNKGVKIKIISASLKYM